MAIRPKSSSPTVVTIPVLAPNLEAAQQKLAIMPPGLLPSNSAPYLFIMPRQVVYLDNQIDTCIADTNDIQHFVPPLLTSICSCASFAPSCGSSSWRTFVPIGAHLILARLFRHEPQYSFSVSNRFFVCCTRKRSFLWRKSLGNVEFRTMPGGLTDSFGRG